MGELLKKYGEINIKDNRFDVELNGPIDEDTGGIIHIQNDKARIELSQLDFFDLVATINLAYRELKKIKGDDIDE